MLVRIILTHKTECPTREQLLTTERTYGENLLTKSLSHSSGIEWAGWIIEDDTFKLSAQWFLEVDDLVVLIRQARLIQSATHDIAVYHVDDEEEFETKLL